MNFSQKIIVQFKYNNKNFCIIENNLRKLIFFIKDNIGIRFDFSKEETEVFSIVYKSLLINYKNVINLGIKEIKNNRFNIFYDFKNKLHYWYEVDGGNLKETNKEMNCYLNYKYNNHNLIYNNLYDLKDGNIDIPIYNEDKNFINRIVKIGKNKIIVLIAAGISLTAFSKCTIEKPMIERATHTQIYLDELEKHKSDMYLEDSTHIYLDYVMSVKTYEEELQRRKEREYNFEEIEKAIQSNYNIGEEEKKLLLNLKFLFDENHMYMDLDTIIERLRTLDIKYVKEKAKDRSGQYNIERNQITIFESEEFSLKKITVLMHEILHVLQEGDEYYNLTLELSNELLTREVLRRMNEMNLFEDSSVFENNDKLDISYGKGYYYQMYVEYLLANLLNQEQLKQYQMYPNEDILIDALIKIEGKQINKSESEIQEIRTRAHKLIESINEMKEYENNVLVLKFSEQQYYNIYVQIDYYYQKKYNKKMETDMETDIYRLNSNCLNNMKGLMVFNKKWNTINKVINRHIEESDNKKIDKHSAIHTLTFIKPKTYFSESNENTIIYYYINGDNIQEIILDDEINQEFYEQYCEDVYKNSAINERE